VGYAKQDDRMNAIKIDYGTQLMLSMGFLSKVGDIGKFVSKLNCLLSYELQQLTMSKMSPFVNSRSHVPVHIDVDFLHKPSF